MTMHSLKKVSLSFAIVQMFDLYLPKSMAVISESGMMYTMITWVIQEVYRFYEDFQMTLQADKELLKKYGFWEGIEESAKHLNREQYKQMCTGFSGVNWYWAHHDVKFQNPDGTGPKVPEYVCIFIVTLSVLRSSSLLSK